MSKKRFQELERLNESSENKKVTESIKRGKKRRKAKQNKKSVKRDTFVSRSSPETIKEQIAAAQKVLRKYESYLLSLPNVVGVGVGYKIKKGIQTDQISIIVYVEKKLPKNLLSDKEIVPVRLDGFPTDVVETGQIEAL